MKLKLEDFKSIISEIVYNISVSDYDEIKANGQNGRVDINDLKRVIVEYDCTVIPLSDRGFSKAEIYLIDENRLDVYVPLWTKEEGRSDLTLSLSCCFINGIPKVEINDLRVL